METYTGLRVEQLGRLLAAVPQHGAEGCRWGRSWRLPLAERLLQVTACYRTNLTMPQLASLFGISPTALCRVMQRLGRCSGVLGVIFLDEDQRVVLTCPGQPRQRVAERPARR